MRKNLWSTSISDSETLQMIKDTWINNGIILDPHGAVGLVGLRRNLNKNQTGVFFETAHPIKFIESITDIIGIKEDFFKISTNFKSNETIHSIDNNYTSLIKFLKSIN